MDAVAKFLGKLIDLLPMISAYLLGKSQQRNKSNEKSINSLIKARSALGRYINDPEYRDRLYRKYTRKK